MSIESAKAYIERLRTDEEFRERMKDAADKEARIALVNAEGFDFSDEDIKAVKSELSDEELEGVSGGFGVWVACWPSDVCGIYHDGVAVW